jgi:antitoxin (DNA-binding transcriptional repressor) of toxin-antitoxin stability system
MKIAGVGEIKANFSEILSEVKNGEKIVISYGKKKEKIAVMVPYAQYQRRTARRIGLLENKASFDVADDFTVSDDELLVL